MINVEPIPGVLRAVRDFRASLPDRDLHLFRPGLDSGAFDYFTAPINGAEGVGRGDYTASEDEQTLVNAISRDELAFGYLSFAYYVRNKDILKLLAIEESQPGQSVARPVFPSTETILNGRYPKLSRPLLLLCEFRPNLPVRGRGVRHFLFEKRSASCS